MSEMARLELKKKSNSSLDSTCLHTPLSTIKFYSIVSNKDGLGKFIRVKVYIFRKECSGVKVEVDKRLKFKHWRSKKYLSSVKKYWYFLGIWGVCKPGQSLVVIVFEPVRKDTPIYWLNIDIGWYQCNSLSVYWQLRWHSPIPVAGNNLLCRINFALGAFKDPLWEKNPNIFSWSCKRPCSVYNVLWHSSWLK